MDYSFGGNVVLPFAEYIFRYEVAGITVYFRHPHKRSWIVDVQSVLGRDCLLHAIIITRSMYLFRIINLMSAPPRGRVSGVSADRKKV